MPSIHQKITLTYLLMAAVIAGLSFVTLVDMVLLERQIQLGVAVADFKDATLEIRRWEKNLFLYSDIQSSRETQHYLAVATTVLQDKNNDFTHFADAATLENLKSALTDYGELLAAYPALLPTAQRETHENRIRAIGHRISRDANELANRERENLSATISRSRWGLLISIIIVVVLVIGIGYRLANLVVKPLRRLEADLMPIAAGQLDHLEVASNDRELVAFATAFNRMLTEMESRRRRLLQSEKLAALGVLTAGVAHEINNPLSNISSSAQLLLEELATASPEQLAAWSNQIISEAERAHHIVAALLEYGQKRDFELKSVNLAEIVDKTLLLLKGPLRKGDAVVTTEIPEDLNITADRQRLQQVFINLIHNAILSADSGVCITIKARRCNTMPVSVPANLQLIGDPDSCKTPKVEIEISDTGKGIPAEMLPNIFVPFFTTRGLGRGIGLGLYIVQDIIKQHNGCIAVDSRVGVGTRFLIYLPYQEDAA